MDGANKFDAVLAELVEASRRIDRGCDQVRAMKLRRRILGHLERVRSALQGGVESIRWEQRKAGRTKPTTATKTE